MEESTQGNPRPTERGTEKPAPSRWLKDRGQEEGNGTWRKEQRFKQVLTTQSSCKMSGAMKKNLLTV